MIGLEKLAKVTEFSLAKATIVETQNRDLVNTRKEAQKRKHQQSRELGKARVIGKDTLEARMASKFDK